MSDDYAGMGDDDERGSGGGGGHSGSGGGGGHSGSGGGGDHIGGGGDDHISGRDERGGGESGHGEGQDSGYQASSAEDAGWLEASGLVVGSVLAGAFLQAFGAKFGEQAAERFRTLPLWRRLRQRYWRSPDPRWQEEEEQIAVTEFGNAVRELAARHGSNADVLHLTIPHRGEVLLEVHPNLPFTAIDQIQRMNHQPARDRRSRYIVAVWVDHVAGRPGGAWIARQKGDPRWVWNDDNRRWEMVNTQRGEPHGRDRRSGPTRRRT